VQFSGGATGNTVQGGVLAAGGNTFAADIGSAANQVLGTSLIGGPSPLIVNGGSLKLSSGTPTQGPNGTTYPLTISGGIANDTLTVQAFSAFCSATQVAVQLRSRCSRPTDR
jgi:hypothetical protein